MSKVRISKHISYNEAVRSSTAKRYGIKNEPTEFQLRNMKMVAENCFEPLRRWHGKPLFISSFLRSKALNEHPAIKGSKTSQHLQGLYSEIEEAALDIDADYFDNGITNNEIFKWLDENVEYDQLILEYPDEKGQAGWIHVSYRKGANRRMKMVATKNEDGDTVYTIIK